MKLQKSPAPYPMAGDNVPANFLRAGVMSKYTWIPAFGKENAAHSQHYGLGIFGDCLFRTNSAGSSAFRIAPMSPGFGTGGALSGIESHVFV